MTSLLGSISDEKVGMRCGIPKSAVQVQRRKLGIPSFQSRRVLTEAEAALLGTDIDRVVAERLGVSKAQVLYARQIRGIEAWRGSARVLGWKESVAQKLGLIPDGELAALIGLSTHTVAKERQKRGIAAHRAKRVSVLAGYLPALGTKSDAKIAAEYGVHMSTVANVRKRHGIPSNTQRRAWKEDELKLLGKYSDAAVARMTGRTRSGVKMERMNRRIPGIDPAEAGRLHREANAVIKAWSR